MLVDIDKLKKEQKRRDAIERTNKKIRKLSSAMANEVGEYISTLEVAMDCIEKGASLPSILVWERVLDEALARASRNPLGHEAWKNIRKRAKEVLVP